MKKREYISLVLILVAQLLSGLGALAGVHTNNPAWIVFVYAGLVVAGVSFYMFWTPEKGDKQ